MTRMVKRLSNLDIDEVSLVDRPANQHGLVAIAKADSQEEEMSGIFNADGDEVFLEELNAGDLVYSEDGTEFRVTDGDLDDEGYAEAEVEERELASVGKSVFPLSGAKVKAAGRLGRMAAKDTGAKTASFARKAPGSAALLAGGGAAVGAGAGYAGGRVGKSLGQQVMEELSKSFTDDERNEVISKAMGLIEDVAKRNEELEQTVSDLIESREVELFGQIAKGYELPGEDADLGGLLYRASQVLPEADVLALDRLFTSHGQIAKSFYEEQGVHGGAASNVLDAVYGLAGEAISKNADLGLTQEQAVTALFDSNPGAYEEYLAEQGPNGL